MTERRKRLLERTGDELRAIVDGLGDAVVVHDLDGRLLAVNRIACERLGYDEDEILAMSAADISTPEDAALLPKRIAEIVEDGRSLFETALVARDGREIPIELACRLAELDGGSAIVCAARDASGLRRLDAELVRSEKLETIATLAGGLAHDFNNILTGITANLAVARDELADGEDPSESISEAEAAAQRASKLTAQLLTFARGGAPIKETASIAEILKHTARFALAGSRSRFEHTVEDDLWPADIDKTQISQVIQNLVINADQAMPEGGIIEIRARNVEIGGESGDHGGLEPGRYIEISVADRGAGISEEDLDRVFDPFFTTKTEGTGLGLSAAHSIVRAHGGRIAAISPPGAGATFTVLLPASAGERPAEPKIESDPPSGRPRILVMDDDELILRTLSRVLPRMGYDVEVTEDGAEAIAAYRDALAADRRFDAVIMDLTVPGGMGGAEAIRGIREMDPGAVAIVSSGYSDDPVMSDHSRYGFDGVVVKPYDVKALTGTLESLIGENGEVAR